jgi:hypothetical protein
MPWRGASYEGELASLGWDLIDWVETYLRVPSGPQYGKPFRLTDEQAAFWVRWYAVDPRTGKFIYRRGAKRAAKGKGKSPELAAWAITELVGPVLFDGWNSKGEPVGKPWRTPLEQVAACSEDQTGNTYGAAYSMVADSPVLDEYRIDLGRTKMFLRDRPMCGIEPVTAAAGSREGQLITAAVLDETHLWTRTNGGRRLAAVLRRNLGKSGGRSIESTNAFVPGEHSVAEDTHKTWANGEPGLLYEAVEAPWVEDLTDKRALRRALKVAYGDAKWVDITRVIAEIQDPSTDPSDARRFYLNQLVAHERAAVDPHVWARLARPDLGQPPDGTRIGVGFDGSISNDATALRGCTEDGHRFTIRIWERPLGAPEGWRVPRLEVHAAVEETMTRWDVGRMLCDPAKWYTEIETWMDLYNTGRRDEDAVVAMFDTNKPTRMSAACDRYLTALAEGWGSHDADPVATRHVLAMAKEKARVNAPDDDGRTRWVFVKMDTRKIDAGVADVLSVEAAQTMPPEVDESSVYEERGLLVLG